MICFSADEIAIIFVVTITISVVAMTTCVAICGGSDNICGGDENICVGNPIILGLEHFVNFGEKDGPTIPKIRLIIS